MKVNERKDYSYLSGMMEEDVVLIIYFVRRKANILPISGFSPHLMFCDKSEIQQIYYLINKLFKERFYIIAKYYMY